MKITEVTYGRTINLGNYQSARIELKADVEEGEVYDLVLGRLKELVRQEAEQIKAS